LGSQRENLHRAIACYEVGLRVYTESDFPAEWAKTQNNLGNAYMKLPTGDRATNLWKAIACYAASLRVFTETDFPAEWAKIQYNLGNTYTKLPTGDRTSNLKKAIACYEDALHVRTETEFPTGWAETQSNLGEALEKLSAITKEKSLLIGAIACFEAAIRGYAVCGMSDEAEGIRKRADEARKKL
jgi:tetratricopeptide (TPR) repeat protein